MLRILKDAALALKTQLLLVEGTVASLPQEIEGDTKFLQEAYNAAEVMKSEYGYSLFQGSTHGIAQIDIQSDYANNPEKSSCPSL